MELSLTTPALLFSTVSLLMVAYTNRFLAISSLIRSLHEKYQHHPDDILLGQIRNLRLRVDIIKKMQIIAIGSLLLSTLCMFELFADLIFLAKWTFGICLLMLATSLCFAIAEVQLSTKALNLQLRDIELEKKIKRDEDKHK